MGITFGKSPEEWPLDLRCFLQTASEIAFSKSQDLRVQKEHLTPVKIDSVMRMGLRPKKMHEVAHMAALVTHVAKLADSHVVIDFGSGKGYLGQVISVTSGIDVIGIDSQEDLNRSALSRSEKIARWAERRKEAVQLGRVCGSYCSTSSAKKDAEQSKVGSVATVTMVVQSGDHLQECVDITDRAVITGLHTCGDLHTSLLHIFAQSNARALVSVGCCYHRRTDPDDPAANEKVVCRY